MSSIGIQTGTGEIESAITQMIMQALDGLTTTSAGGDSPKTNTVVDLGEIGGFGDILDNAISTMVMRSMEDRGLIGNGNGGGLIGSEGQGATSGVGNLLGSAKQTASLAQNPGALVSMGLGMLPQAALVSFVVSLIPLIINELTKPGGEFDLRWKREVEKEYNALQARQNQYDISVGERGVIFQNRAGFINKQGANSNTNSLKMIREGGINKKFLTETDYVDHSKGFDV